ncbi:ribonuclease III [Gammaproteobacteria bacterium]|nr:ribonuclease III [Gammaproteobacteria bacterium]MDC6460134.1 ribonuclease III [Gammaproteobacteria bacterium]
MNYDELQSQLGHKFKNKELLELALTHKSFSSSYNNERLEFLGDSILSAIISQYLFNKFNNEKEGLLTRMRSYLVKAETLVIKAEEFALGDYIKLSKGTANLSKDRKNSILEDAFEAIIGAIFIDAGWEHVNEITLKIFNKNLLALSADMTFKDAKTELQELLQSKKYELPKYLIEDTGDGCFSCNINYQETLFESTGPSKRIAETNVAMKVLAHIKKTT